MLERVVEGILHRLHHQEEEEIQWTAQRLVVPLAVDRVDDARQITVPQKDEIRAHPPDLS